MRNDSYKTVISRIAEYIDDWRKAQGMSQITVVDEIVKTHDRIEGPAATGIVFEKSSDEWNRQKNNADRIWRWLDDKSKDRNLLPINFLPSILAAMPEEQRRAFLAELLAPLNLGVRSLEGEDTDEFTFEHVCDTHIETAKAMQLLAIAHKDPTESNLQAAERAAEKVTERFARTKKIIAGARKGCRALITKAFNRKVTA